MSKELQEIIGRLSCLEAGRTVALATVVDVVGSGYRLPGARMLISETGETFGTVSGGCLEADVRERALVALSGREPILVTYVNGGRSDPGASLNMGCDGTIRILIETLGSDSCFSVINECMRERRPVAVATLIAAYDAISGLGSRIVFNGSVAFDDMVLARADLISELSEVLNGGRSQCVNIGRSEYFIEVIQPPTEVIVFGAGQDALPVVRFAKELGWRVTLVDHREALVDRFADYAGEIVVCCPDSYANKLNIGPDAAAIVMTHNYELDREILPYLFAKRLRYVGMLGPRHRTNRLVREITKDGFCIERQMMESLFAPIGLDIGATTPEAIALSIVAELQSCVKRARRRFAPPSPGTDL